MRQDPRERIVKNQEKSKKKPKKYNMKRWNKMNRKKIPRHPKENIELKAKDIKNV